MSLSEITSYYYRKTRGMWTKPAPLGFLDFTFIDQIEEASIIEGIVNNKIQMIDDDYCHSGRYDHLNSIAVGKKVYFKSFNREKFMNEYQKQCEAEIEARNEKIRKHIEEKRGYRRMKKETKSWEYWFNGQGERI